MKTTRFKLADRGRLGWRFYSGANSVYINEKWRERYELSFYVQDVNCGLVHYLVTIKNGENQVFQPFIDAVKAWKQHGDEVTPAEIVTKALGTIVVEHPPSRA